MKYLLRDSDNLFENAIIYSIIMGGLTLVDIGVTSFLIQFGALSIPAATVFSTWLVIFAYLPFRNIVKRGIKRLLKREIYELYDVSMELSYRLLSSEDMQCVIETAEGIIDETLHPNGVETVMFDKCVGLPASKPLSASFPASLRDIKEPRPLAAILQPEDLPKEYSRGVIVPVIVSNCAIGCFMLQNKRSGRFYSREDMRLLRMVSNQTALAMGKMCHREGYLRKEADVRAEKERISREIHDGMGSYFTNAIMMVDMIESKNRRAEGDEESLKNLKKLLTDGVADLRDLIWTVEEEDSTLFDTAICIKGKVAQFLNKEKIKHDVEVSVGNERLIIPQMVRHNMLRIVQESLTNIIKHAEADNVFTSIYERDKKITIKIKDNGKGFMVDASKKGFGLRNMRKRCEQMGARLNIRSEPSKGTEIEIEATA